MKMDPLLPGVSSDPRLSCSDILALRRLCWVWPPDLIDEKRLLQMSQTLARRPDALAALRGALRLPPDAPVAHERLGLALQLAGLLQESVASYCVSLLYAGPVARIVIGLATVLERGGALPEAAHFFEFATELEPWCSEHKVALARALISRGDSGRAIWLLLDIVREQPRDADCVLLLAGCALELGELDVALPAARKSTILAGQSPAAWLCVAQVAAAAGFVSESRAADQTARRLVSNAE